MVGRVRWLAVGSLGHAVCSVGLLRFRCFVLDGLEVERNKNFEME